ncbi:hypothetical protein HED63_22415 [Ochrobactrum cytisi]|nr:hypothetical protein [Brucella cytisi]
MARAEMKTTARKGRRMEARSETDKPVVNKSEGALNVALAAGALGLGIAMLEQQKAAAANADLLRREAKRAIRKLALSQQQIIQRRPRIRPAQTLARIAKAAQPRQSLYLMIM